MDKERQEDELDALKSIYNEEEFSYCKENDQYEVYLKIFVSLPEKYFFAYKDNRQNTQPLQKVYISHLPPLVLSVILPPNYPSTSPAKFILRCSWLSKTAITKLCKKLDEIWENNKGEEILFLWISFLQSEILELLNIQESVNIDNAYTFYKIRLEKTQKAQELVAENAANGDQSNTENKFEADKALSKNLQTQPTDKKCAIKKRIKKSRYKRLIDERAISDILADVNPVKMLIDYNEKRNLIEFRKNFYFCKICYADKLGEHCTQFLPCTHVFCKECIIGYFEVKIKDGAVQNIICPEEKCKSEATPGQIKEVVSPELFSKYDSILLSATLDTMNDIIYCPRKSCQYPVSREPDEIMANCPVCQYAFCVYCKAVYHGIEPCKINKAEYKNLIKEYQKASDKRKSELELIYGKKRLEELVDNAMSQDWILEHSQCCPNCNAAIEKSDGCNKMTCWKCNTFFCWLCKEKLSRNDPYKHYRDPNSRCFTMLNHNLLHEDDNDDEEDFDFNYEDIEAYLESSDDDWDGIDEIPYNHNFYLI